MIEQGGNLWAVQAVQDPTTGNSDIAWYRIPVANGDVKDDGEEGVIASSSMYYTIRRSPSTQPGQWSSDSGGSGSSTRWA